ncbi:MAG: citrate synthase [Myxococcota bacterium]
MGQRGQGLDGVVAADTVMSHVDGAAGELWIRGHRVEALAAPGRLEPAIAVLWDGAPPDDRYRAPLVAARVAVWPAIARAPLHPDASVTVRATLAALDDPSPLTLVAATGLIVARWIREDQGGAPIPPDPSLDHAADLVRMIRGEADPARAVALGRYLCAVVDHGMNASTFAARVVASTRSDPASAVVAAVGALKGPLHGGAPGPVLDMLDAIGTPDRAAAWIARALDAGERIMGIGHRVYRVRDPRVAVLEAAIGALAEAGCATDRTALAHAVEAEAEAALAKRKPDRPLKANVEFATAVLLEAIGIPRGAFTATFAAGRVVGWLAHVAEQQATGRLIRPESRYVGPIPA